MQRPEAGKSLERSLVWQKQRAKGIVEELLAEKWREKKQSPVGQDNKSEFDSKSECLLLRKNRQTKMNENKKECLNNPMGSRVCCGQF